MSLKVAAIIDNDVLVNLLTVGILNKLANLYSPLFISDRVVEEFLQEDASFEHLPSEKRENIMKDLEMRKKFILKITHTNTFIKRCMVYDEILFATINGTEGINEGEAESIAQAMKRQVRYFITDDKPCTEQIKIKQFADITPINSLRILAKLQLQEFLESPIEDFARLYQCRPFSSEALLNAFREAAQELGINKKSFQKALPRYKAIVNCAL